MQCPRCQHENPQGMKFCGECGARLASVCPSCGASNPPVQKFCGDCGTGLGQTDRAAKYGTPQSYTPRHLAEKILTSKAALEGERKQVTVLFADLKGSMELLADRDPEEARKLLDPVLEHMMEAVHRYEGTVNQVMGDGIMALFGAPIAHEDHAVRACYAALRIQDSIRRHADTLRPEGIPIQVRIGLNSGDVVVRSVGSDLRMDYTAVGQTTHLAARMEQMAEPNSVLMTSETFALAEGYLLVKPLGARMVKGLATARDVYELVGTSAARSRLSAAAARGLTHFVGRQRELDNLRLALERARAGHGQVVAVVGEPGVGKSRLYWEFTHSKHVAGCLVLESLSVSYGRASSYLPTVSLLKAYFQIQTDDSAETIRKKVARKVLSLDRALELRLAPLLALLDVDVEDRQWQALDPPQRRQRTLDALKRLLLRESQEQPLVVVFEDLHWVDAETQALLDALVESLPTARVLLLTNYRPEYQHRWGSKTYYGQLRLDPLPPADADGLLRVFLGEDPAMASLKQLLIERTEGNPFFLEESVRTLIETQALAGTGGAYRLTCGLDKIAVPATVEAVLAARIDRLPSEEKRLLQTAAVVGKDVPYPVLCAVSEFAEAEVQQGLAHLQAAEFLYEAQLFPNPEYTFKHALTHQVVYGSILRGRRLALHSHIVRAIEGLYPELPDDQVDGLASHAMRGELWDDAAKYHRRAGLRAGARSAVREAVIHFDQALVALEHLPEGRQRLELAFDLRLDIRTPLWLLGEMERAYLLLREAEQLAHTLGDEGRMGWASVFLFNVFWMMGQPQEARPYAERARAAGDAAGDRALREFSSVNLTQLHLTSGDSRAARDVARAGLEQLRQEGVSVPRTWAPFTSPTNGRLRSLLGLALAGLGEFDEAIAVGLAALREAEASEYPFNVMYALTMLDRTYRLKGDFNQSTTLLDRLFALTDEYGLRVQLAQHMASRGDCYVHCGRVAEGVALLEEAVETAKAKKVMFDLPQMLLYLAEGYLVAGRAEAALPCAQEALKLTKQRAERLFEGHALQLAAEAASCAYPQDLDTCEEWFRSAINVFDEGSARPYLARCHLAFGAFYQRIGRRQETERHLTAAAAMFNQMGMTYWREKAEAGIAALKSLSDIKRHRTEQT